MCKMSDDDKMWIFCTIAQKKTKIYACTHKSVTGYVEKCVYAYNATYSEGDKDDTFIMIELSEIIHTAKYHRNNKKILHTLKNNFYLFIRTKKKHREIEQNTSEQHDVSFQSECGLRFTFAQYT